MLSPLLSPGPKGAVTACIRPGSGRGEALANHMCVSIMFYRQAQEIRFVPWNVACCMTYRDEEGR